MAIITEHYMTREDGAILNRTYSDKGMKVERDGVLYDEAIDLEYLNRQYTETDEPIKEDADQNELTLKEKAAAYDILMGG